MNWQKLYKPMVIAPLHSPLYGQLTEKALVCETRGCEDIVRYGTNLLSGL